MCIVANEKPATKKELVVSGIALVFGIILFSWIMAIGIGILGEIISSV